MGEQLGRLLDPEALDASPGPRARLRIEVPADWLAEGAELAVTAPARLACARCGGGGCDACGRSGALRAPESPADRGLRARLPGDAPAACALRIPRPFGAEHAIALLLLEVREAPAPSAGVERLDPPEPPEPAPGRSSALPGLILVIASLVVAAVAALWGR